MKRILLALLLILSATTCWYWLAAVPALSVIPDDGGTGWRPIGPPVVPGDGEMLNIPDTFQTMHVGSNNTDELWIATAPQQRIAWSVEEDLYIPEGPTMDNQGQVYFSPLFPREDVSLVALHGDTGERLWTLPHHGDSKGAGAPLILTLPGQQGQQVIYHATYHHAWAVEPSGRILWHRPTGLRYSGKGLPPHAWGMNYVAQLDALVSVTQDGKVIALSRQTGDRLLARPFDLPGAPAGEDARNMPAAFVMKRGDDLATEQFGQIPGEHGLFTEMVRIIYGADSEVSNYYAVAPGTGRLYIAATAPDNVDGVTDGISANGALYALQWQREGDHLQLNIAARFDFEGGTGSTPSVANDGQRVYVSDENGNIFALDKNLKEIWRFNVGDQVAASIAVSANNAELYAVTRYDIFKLWDRGDQAQLAWKGELDAFSNHRNINALTPTITANGIAISIGASREIGKSSLLKVAGYGLLDRNTGQLRSFVLSPEESVAVTVVDRDGGFTIAHSPVRRLGSRGILGDSVAPVRGGVTRFKSSNDLLLAREAACAAAHIVARSTALSPSDTASLHWDRQQISTLRKQVERALLRSGSAIDAQQPPAALCDILQQGS